MEVSSNANDFTPYVPYETRFQAGSSPIGEYEPTYSVNDLLFNGNSCFLWPDLHL